MTIQKCYFLWRQILWGTSCNFVAMAIAQNITNWYDMKKLFQRNVFQFRKYHFDCFRMAKEKLKESLFSSPTSPPPPLPRELSNNNFCKNQVVRFFIVRQQQPCFLLNHLLHGNEIFKKIFLNHSNGICPNHFPNIFYQFWNLPK